jgi:tRNA (cmo5U34)-methyltransferase
MTGKTVRRAFDKAAEDYDKIKVEIIPKYGEVERLIRGYLTFPKTRRIHILELGTGTGKWASGVLRAFPRAQYHGIDFSNHMLHVASRRLERFGDRVTLENLDLNRQRPVGPFDLIYSAFTIHHVRDKRGLFKDLRALLKPDGLLMFADITIASSPDLEARFLESWKAFMRKSPWPDHKINTIVDDHLENDIPDTVENQLKYMGEAGFASYDLIWRHEKFAAFHARR